MAESVKHRIFLGNQSGNPLEQDGVLLTPAFTFDRTDIFFDSTTRTFDETV